MKFVTVTIEYKGNRTPYKLRRGLGLQCLNKNGSTPLEFSCRAADCGVCAFSVLEGAEALNEPELAEADFLKAMHAGPEERLACQCRAFGDITISVDAFD